MNSQRELAEVHDSDIRVMFIIVVDVVVETDRVTRSVSPARSKIIAHRRPPHRRAALTRSAGATRLSACADSRAAQSSAPLSERTSGHRVRAPTARRSRSSSRCTHERGVLVKSYCDTRKFNLCELRRFNHMRLMRC